MGPGEIISIIAAAAIIAAAVWWRMTHKTRLTRGTAAPIPARLPYSFRTPGGVFVASVTNYVPDAALAAIDEGITNQLTRTEAAHPEWAAKRLLPDYRVIFIDPMATNAETEPGSPALLVWGIQSAGTCIGVGGDGVYPEYIVLPHQADSGWNYIDYLMHSAWHESEHIREWFNDQAVFNSFIGSGDIHPHFP